MTSVERSGRGTVAIEGISYPGSYDIQPVIVTDPSIGATKRPHLYGYKVTFQPEDPKSMPLGSLRDAKIRLENGFEAAIRRGIRVREAFELVISRLE